MPSLPPILAAVTAADPYGLYAELRRSRPFGFDPELGAWVAADAAAVAAVLAEPRLEVRPAAERVPRALAGTPAGEIFRHLVRMDDSPDQARRKAAIRAILGRATATAAAAAGVAGAAAGGRSAAALAARTARGELTLGELSFRLPVFAVGELLGLPAGGLERIEALVGAYVRCLAPGGAPAEIAAGQAAAGELLAEFGALLDAEPDGAGLLAALARELPGERPAMLANAIGLLTQTYEATAGLIGNTLLALARRPEWRERVLAERGAIAALVREVARFDPPVQNTRRFAAETLSFRGQEIGEGQMVLVLLASANRDPAHHDRPDEFDPARPQPETATWGQGRHACPGSALAAAIAASAVAALAAQDALPDASVPFAYRPSVNTRIPLFGPPAGRNAATSGKGFPQKKMGSG